MAERTPRRRLRAQGACVYDLLDAAASAQVLGPVFGADLTKTEPRCLVCSEWAQGVANVVWRCDKIGLRMTLQGIARVDAVLDALRSQRDQAA